VAEIRKTWNEVEPVPQEVIDSYSVPTRLTTNAELDDGTIVRIGFVVEDGHSRIRSVTVEADGIDSTTLRTVPLRKIVAEGLRRAVRRVQVSPDGTAELREIKDANKDKSLGAVVAEIVGYLGVVTLKGSEVTVTVKKADR
jgi:hypothetical protein